MKIAFCCGCEDVTCFTPSERQEGETAAQLRFLSILIWRLRGEHRASSAVASVLKGRDPGSEDGLGAASSDRN